MRCAAKHPVQKRGKKRSLLIDKAISIFLHVERDHTDLNPLSNVDNDTIPV